MEYRIISTGSKGNAVILNDEILIDCGVSYKAIKPYVKGLKLVLLTHIHSDHFKPETIRKLANERPTLRFGCGKWLLKDLVKCVPKRNIDIYFENAINQYADDLKIIMIPTKHNVENCAYKIYTGSRKIFYATDCNNLDGITAKNFDLYMIEANYEEHEIQERIAEKEASGQYVYEYQVLRNHLSKAKADEFIIANAGENSRFVYLHGHEGTGCCGCPISYKAVDDLEKIRPYEPNVVKAAWNIFGDSYRYRQKYNEYKFRRREEEKQGDQLYLFDEKEKENKQ